MICKIFIDTRVKLLTLPIQNNKTENIFTNQIITLRMNAITCLCILTNYSYYNPMLRLSYDCFTFTMHYHQFKFSLATAQKHFRHSVDGELLNLYILCLSVH